MKSELPLQKFYFARLLRRFRQERKGTNQGFMGKTVEFPKLCANCYVLHFYLLSAKCYVLCAMCCVLCAGSCAYIPLRIPVRNPQLLPAPLASYYDYPRQPLQATRKLLRETPITREWLVQFPLSVSGFEPTEPIVELEWFESKAPGRHPAIVFHPILGGDYPIEREICRYLACHRFHVAMIHRKTLKISPDQSVEHLELLLRQGVIRIRQVVDWMEQQDNVDPQRLGSFGISMGGITAIMAAAVEPRLKAHVAALPGGSIPDILLTSHDSLLTKPLERYLSQRRMDRKELDRLLRANIKTDPLLLSPYVDSKPLLLFIALIDRTIGYPNALRLWRALGHPKVVFLPFGHYTSYLCLPYLQYESLRFFQTTLQ